MATYVITGASRGIGLELVKQLMQFPTSQVSKVFALTRDVPSTALYQLIQESRGRIEHGLVSVDKAESVQRAADQVAACLDGKGVDVLINNAGFQQFQSGATESVLPEDLASHFDVNVIGCHRMITAFLPLLNKGAQKKVINLSSTMGSIKLAENFKLAPSTAYKVSKTALNMLNAQYALDYGEHGFTFLCVSPGWLKTDLGGHYAELDVRTGVQAVVTIVLESDRSKNGKFLDIFVPGHEDAYQGGEIPW